MTKTMLKSETDISYRNKRRLLKKRLLVFLIIVLVYAVLSTAAAAVSFGVIFRRAADNSLFRYDYYSEDTDAYPRTPVEFMSCGNTLRGYIYDTENEKGMILLCSGMHENSESHLPVVFRLIDNGYDVMTFDLTGHGSSGGDGLGSLCQPRRDADAAVGYIRTLPQYEGTPLILFGYSAGGYGAAAAAADDPETAGVVCISAYDRPLGAMYALAEKYAGPAAAAGYPFLWLYSRLMFGAEHDSGAAGLIGGASVPALIIHGTDDEIIPLGYSLYSAAESIGSPEIRTLLVSGSGRSGHITALLSAESAGEINGGPEIRTEDISLDAETMETVITFIDDCANNKIS